MLKKLSKKLLFLLLVFMLSFSSVCLAHEEHEHSNADITAENIEDITTSTTPEIHDGNLYLFGNDILMNKTVHGNTFIFGKDVTVTGQIDGNLFVFADSLNLDACSINSSIYACANSVYYNAACKNLYVTSKSLETSWYSYVLKNFNVTSSDIILKSAIGKDANLICNTLDLGNGSDIPEIFGDLNYSANTRISIPAGVLAGDDSVANYTKDIFTILGFILILWATSIITALVIHLFIKKYLPNISTQLFHQDFSFVALLKAFSIGIITIIFAIALSTILIVIKIGIPLAILLILIFAIICLISLPILAVSITNTLKHIIIKTEKNYMNYLILALVCIVLYGLPLIPPLVAGLVGIIISIILEVIINIIALGLLVNKYLPHKELSEEEKAKIQKAKENKKKIKQEKYEAKVAKKEEKIKDKKVENKEQ